MFGDSFMPRSLFGTSGVRGVANVELTPTLLARIGLAVASYAQGGLFVVGHDTRTSSQLVESAFVSGLISGGCDILELGLAPTPAIAYQTRSLSARSGASITASHNPPEYNGVKLFNSDTMAYSDEQQTEVDGLVQSETLARPKWSGVGGVVGSAGLNEYTSMVVKSTELRRGWKVAIDPGCGATCYLAPVIFRMLGCKVFTVNAQPDGFFPGRSPEPTPSSLTDLCGLVKELRCDVGIAYDGDGDRMTLVGEDGSTVPPDRLLAAYAGYVVAKEKSSRVVVHVDTSVCVDKMVEAAGGQVVRTKVGDVNIAQAIRVEKAVFGGEPVGAWIHPNHHLCPDGILSSVLALKAVEDAGGTVSGFTAKVPVFHVFRGKVECPNNVKPRVMERVAPELPRLIGDTRTVTTVDGVRVDTADGWVLIRPSGTEPLVRVTAESIEARVAERNLAEALELVRRLSKE